MSKPKERSLISFSNDITKTRDEIMSNLELLETKEGQEALQEKIKNLPESPPGELGTASIMGLTYMVFMSSTALKDVDFDPSGLFANLRNSLESRPLDIHYSLIIFTELMLYIDHPSIEQARKLEDLKFEIYRNELLKGDQAEINELLKVKESIGQNNKKFPLYFAYTIRQMSIFKMDEFLTYQLSRYKGNFKSFLNNTLIEHVDDGLFSRKTVKAIEEWLDNNEFSEELIAKTGTHLSNDEKIKIIVECLAWLKEEQPKGGKILFDKDYERLLKYVKSLVLENNLPDSESTITGITYVGFTNRIRYTFYLIHKAIQGTKPIDNLYIEFLHQVFPGNFTGKTSVTKTKFSTPSKKK